MRRKEKEITEKSEIEAVIRKSSVCHVGMSSDNIPYIVPLCFGYKGNAIYVHGSLKGRKIDILQKNQNVCFEFDINAEAVKADTACEWSMKYQSVVGFGKAVFLDVLEQKRKALNIIMNQYSDEPFQFSEKKINGTAVIKIEIESMTGKQSGFK
ncbi:MAG: pyridoxamine 5'-phosphate oxidase family protein [Thermodesulfobacteriota bacterium]|nr:pyridoxamine 5'-phosphate oxidase family protein [Thermodesulfobacteriota bacterium]